MDCCGSTFSPLPLTGLLRGRRRGPILTRRVLGIPRSEWNTTPSTTAPWFTTAISKAVEASSVRRRSASPHPITRIEYRSSTVARYSHPLAGGT